MWRGKQDLSIAIIWDLRFIPILTIKNPAIKSGVVLKVVQE